jgi:pyruvate,water dikinase
MNNVRWFETLGMHDVSQVGGKNASLGEMITALKQQGVEVPTGFATTADAYWSFLTTAGLKTQIAEILSAFHHKHKSLEETGQAIRSLILKAALPEDLALSITAAYKELCKRSGAKNIGVAVRSSATAEDLPDASFAGQQDTYLNISGEKALLQACLKCYASLFTDRAITYRETKGFDHMQIALSIGVQKMVRSDKGGSGVMFTLDTETGFRNAIVVNAGWGLGENIVQGSIDPDEYLVFKPLLSQEKYVPIIGKRLGQKEKKMIYAKTAVKNTKTALSLRKKFVLEDPDILQLARWGALIEKHYQKPMDIEWAKDGQTKKLFIVQARPETVHSRKQLSVFKTYELKEKGKKILEGLAIGEAIVTGPVQVIKEVRDIAKFKEGSILVTHMTSPDWVPIMKRAKGIITDHGGRTSHAAIVSRELGIPAIVGTQHGTEVLKDLSSVTLSCAEGDQGYVYEGSLRFEEREIDLKTLPKIKTQLMINMASPAEAFRFWQLPIHGVGLARMEFIINNIIKIHPMALVHPELVKDKKSIKLIKKLTEGYAKKTDYFVDHLALGIARIAASCYPDPAIVRMSDFKTNEYAQLIGGLSFEPKEENPMLGFRGASRYYSPRYKEGFALECAAIKKVREVMGLSNVVVMIPFCRTLQEADKVLAVMAENGLKRGENGLKVYVMCEIPSNIILADQFAQRFDGFSIGSNDLTQLILGVDRDSEELAPLFDERNEAVKKAISQLIPVAHQNHCKVGICGQAPSDYPDFAAFLIQANIDSLSLNPDSVIGVIQHLGKSF